jgi:hypothetical protein
MITEETIKNQNEPTGTPADQTAQTQQQQPPPPPPVEKVEKRGRHKLDCTCEKCAAKKATPQQQTPQQQSTPPQATQPTPNASGVYDKNPFDMSQYQTTAVVNPASSQPEQVNVGKFITGGLILVVANSVIPMAVLKLIKWIDKDAADLGITSQDIKLDDDQIKDIEPLANEAIKTVVMDMPPMQALVMVLSLVYAGNTSVAVMDAKAKKKEREAARLEKEANKKR